MNRSLINQSLLIRCFVVISGFISGSLHFASAAPTHLIEQSPAFVTNVAPGIILVDFGRVAFGNLKLTPSNNASHKIKVHFGEAFKNGRVDRRPPGTVRYAKTDAVLAGVPVVVAPAADSHPPAILTPPEWKLEDVFKLLLELPDGMTARVELPAIAGAKQVLVNGRPVVARLEKGRWILAEVLSGRATVELK